MRAAMVRAYGGPEQVVTGLCPDPVPGAQDILLRICASPVTAGDRRIRAGDFPRGMGLAARLVLGWRGPRRPILGNAFCAEIAAVGPGVTQFRPGQRVIGQSGMRMGAHADYLCLPERAALAPMPATLTEAEAASLPFGGTTALYFLRDRAALWPGARLLVLGAAGMVGGMAVQIGRILGAEVTGATRPRSLTHVAALGAEALAMQALVQTGRRWDVILDTTGAAPAALWPLLAPGGRMALLAAGLPEMVQSLTLRALLTGTAPERAADLAQLAAWAEAGLLRTPVAACLPLERAAEAHARHEAGGLHGAMVLRCG